MSRNQIHPSPFALRQIIDLPLSARQGGGGGGALEPSEAREGRFLLLRAPHLGCTYCVVANEGCGRGYNQSHSLLRLIYLAMKDNIHVARPIYAAMPMVINL